MAFMVVIGLTVFMVDLIRPQDQTTRRHFVSLTILKPSRPIDLNTTVILMKLFLETQLCFCDMRDLIICV